MNDQFARFLRHALATPGPRMKRREPHNRRADVISGSITLSTAMAIPAHVESRLDGTLRVWLGDLRLDEDECERVISRDLVRLMSVLMALRTGVTVSGPERLLELIHGRFTTGDEFLAWVDALDASSTNA